MPNENMTRVSTEGTRRPSDEKPSCLQRVSTTITDSLEGAFARLGKSIGRHPWFFILGCLLLSMSTAIGLLAFQEVSDPDKLWVPDGAKVLADKDWIEENFPSTVLREQIIGVSSNILTTSGMSALLDFYQNSLTIATSSGITLSDVCIKAGSSCIVYGILELWSYDDTTIRALTSDDIIYAVNTITTSPIYGSTIDMTNYLGQRTTNSSGQIVAAEAAIMTWLTEGNTTMEDTTEAWEDKFIELGNTGHADLSATYVFAGRSFGDESSKAISGDVQLLSVGYVVVILFVVAVLGKFNFMEQRAWLTLGGFVCIGLSILISISLSSAFQQDYGPLQSVLPFLLLGIGADDMFVIMGALNNLSDEEKKYNIPDKVSAVLRHAGVSITVTSLTDFVAFMIGATTIIPALRSFCIYAGIGIIALYVLQAIFFTACLTIDLSRIDAQRDGCCFMIKHDDGYEPNKCSNKQFVPFVFKKGLAKITAILPFKIFTVILALGMFGANLYGFIKLEQYFNPNWFIPTDSYAYAFLENRDNYFPDNGASGYVYCGTISYWGEQTKLEALDTLMSQNTYIKSGTTDSWFATLTSWLNTTSDADIIAMLDANKYPTTDANFVNLTYRLTTEQATTTSSYLRFDTSISQVTASRFPFQHIDMNDAKEQINAMDYTRDMVVDAGFSTTDCFPYSRRYLSWETDKVIQEELYRNLGLAMACVFLVTLILIANFVTSLIVFIGVVFTLVDVAGTMHFWGLTIDTVTSIILILSIGLAVDYSAHIGHMFMTVTGSRQERAQKTLKEMGPPVFYGGFTTFLAFVLLAGSNSYVFKTFFKVNFLVVFYGLFHGLIFLPVMLSWIGPKPYPSATSDEGLHENTQASKENGYDNPGLEMNSNGYHPQKKDNSPVTSIHDYNFPPPGNGSKVKTASLSGSLTPPTPQGGSRKPSSPPPDYSSTNGTEQNLTSVHM